MSRGGGDGPAPCLLSKGVIRLTGCQASLQTSSIEKEAVLGGFNLGGTVGPLAGYLVSPSLSLFYGIMGSIIGPTSWGCREE